MRFSLFATFLMATAIGVDAKGGSGSSSGGGGGGHGGGSSSGGGGSGGGGRGGGGSSEGGYSGGSSRSGGSSGGSSYGGSAGAGYTGSTASSAGSSGYHGSSGSAAVGAAVGAGVGAGVGYQAGQRMPSTSWAAAQSYSRPYYGSNGIIIYGAGGSNYFWPGQNEDDQVGPDQLNSPANSNSGGVNCWATAGPTDPIRNNTTPMTDCWAKYDAYNWDGQNCGGVGWYKGETAYNDPQSCHAACDQCIRDQIHALAGGAHCENTVSAAKCWVGYQPT